MHRPLPRPILLAGLLALPACGAALASASAEPTGCPAEQLEIRDAHQPMEGPSSWTAVCQPPGAEPRQYFCSRAGEVHRVICSEVPPASTSSGTPAGLVSSDQ